MEVYITPVPGGGTVFMTATTRPLPGDITSVGSAGGGGRVEMTPRVRLPGVMTLACKPPWTPGAKELFCLWAAGGGRYDLRERPPPLEEMAGEEAGQSCQTGLEFDLLGEDDLLTYFGPPSAPPGGQGGRSDDLNELESVLLS